MQVTYGSYSFNANDVAINHSRRTMRSDTGYKTGYIDTWILQFRLRGDTQADLKTEIENLYSAFSVDGRNLSLLHNNGSDSAFVTNSSATTSGTRVQRIEFPSLYDAQYTTYIDGLIEIDAETVTNIDVSLIYTETFQVTGNGGPKIVVLETARGLPIKQTTRQNTMVTAVQTGTARSTGQPPRLPVILFPNLLINEQKQESTTASIEGGKLVYTLNWFYPYQDIAYFNGAPQVRL